MALPHFGGKFNNIDIIYNSLFEISTNIDNKNNLLRNNILGIYNNKMIFFEFDKSFEIINKHIGEIIDFKINIQNKKGENVFNLKFNNFKFIGYLNFLNFDYNSNDEKNLEVKYDFTDIQYINNKNLKQLRIDKINDIFDVKNNDYIIKKEFLL
jgi:hypothetical protein